MHDQLTAARTATAARNSMGERVRQLRIARGLTQTELAGDRFSKEYVSQIERGKTRPTPETIEWPAGKLGTDAGFLANGVSTDERGRIESGLSRAEALIEADRNEEAIAEYDALRAGVRGTGAAELEVRALTGEARARHRDRAGCGARPLRPRPPLADGRPGRAHDHARPVREGPARRPDLKMPADYDESHA